MTAAIQMGDVANVAAVEDGSAVTEDAALSADERVELERLRAEVADLRSQVSTAPAPAEQVVIPPSAAAAAVAWWWRPCSL